LKIKNIALSMYSLEHAGTPTMTINLPLGDLEHEWFTTCGFGESIKIGAYIKYV
jgi:hypothetical protein